MTINESEKKRLVTLNGSVWTLGATCLEVEIEDTVLKMVFDVLAAEDMPHEVILGRNLLAYGDVSVTTEGAKFKVKEEHFAMRIAVDEIAEEPLAHIENRLLREEVKILISQYTPQKTEEPKVALKIVLRDETPISQLPRRLAPLEKRIVEKQISEWLKDGIIRKSSSDFSSPIVLAHKKDGTRRLCVDYRRLNRTIVRDHFPIPLIEKFVF